MDKLEKCLMSLNPDQMNDVAKGYLRAWYVEYRYRICDAESYKNRGKGFIQRSAFDVENTLPETWAEIEGNEERFKVKAVDGLNWD